MNAELPPSAPALERPAAARTATRIALLLIRGAALALSQVLLRRRQPDAADLDDRQLADIGLTRWDVARHSMGRGNSRDRAEHLRQHGHWRS